MAYHDYISETEAANFAGVSRSTLERFAEAGYLKLETDTDGLRLYSKGELEELFGLSEQMKRSIEVEVIDDVPRSATLQSQDDSHRDDDLDETIEADKEHTAESEPLPDQSQSYWAEVVNASPARELRGAESIEQQDIEVEAVPSTASAQDKGDAQSGEQPINSLSSRELKLELIKLRSIVELQEKLLDRQDREIATLRKDCEWLRTRIERSEEKGDRDQLLLLAETQMIRKLVSMQAQPKSSPLRAALEWVGLVAPKREELPTVQP